MISDDGTWRPFVPLPDDFVSALNRTWLWPRTTRLYSSEGVTEIHVTRNPLRRVWAMLRLTLGFGKLADRRNWQSGSGEPDQYLRTLKRMGFRVEFRPHCIEPIESAHDPSVVQFFPAVVLLSSPAYATFLWDWARDYAFYFGSAFENTLSQLVLFAAVALVLFLAKHAWSNYRFSRSRRSIPLSIGGWGTRGKSGTERLKAAVFSATGHGIVSKTTGCEAMFIHGNACGDPLEIPLYRPGDKATIWEQANLINLSKRLRPSVFLWECMALTPSYVDVLQRQWMDDDIATITNTYPDHEDLQGPSGFDVASTISGFVPRNSRVLTSERQMRPLLQARCDESGSSLRSVGWLESGLITDDLLARFPYEEHPDNIALVASMSEELGYDYDFALKSMADFLIPDLGVLKTHRAAPIGTVEVEFTNGMSANERFGCLGNWKRLKFDQQDPVGEPSVWISTVVNNRADRVARSRVFASIVVNDLGADRHFLIGSNLKGLQGFVWEEWDRFVAGVQLCPDDEPDAIAAREMIVEIGQRMRIPQQQRQIVDELAAMLGACSLGDDLPISELANELSRSSEQCAERLRTLGVSSSEIDKVRRQLRLRIEQLKLHEELCELADAVTNSVTLSALRVRTHAVLKEWFAAKLVVIEDYDATGDEVIQRIVDETPPGYKNRVMGLQNIKGTGLDFVYRFHAWDICEQGCELLRRSEQNHRQQGINLLEGLTEFGVLCRDTITSTLAEARAATPPLNSEMLVQLDGIQEKLVMNEEPLPAGDSEETGDASSWLLRNSLATSLIGKAEQLLEVHDSLRRRDTADQIYRDLAQGRIGRQRAVQELRKINKRQKGGWLASRLIRS